MEHVLQFFPVVLQQVVEVVADNLGQHFPHVEVFLALHLQQQALAQVARTHSRWVECLQASEHLAYLLGGGFEIVVDGHLVADGVETLAQQTVAVERAYQVFHDKPLALVEFQFHHLLLQFVVERHHVGWLHRLASGVDGQIVIVVVAVLVDRGGHLCNRRGWLCLPRAVTTFLQCRVLVHLLVQKLGQLVDGFLYHLSHEHLLGSEALLGFLLLGLFLYLFGGHGYLKYSWSWAA